VSRLIDLGAVRAARRRLASIAESTPALTTPDAHARLSGDLNDLLDEENHMANDEVVNLRVPSGTKDRAAALTVAVEQSDAFQVAVSAASAIGARAPRVSTSLVLRMALIRGLDELEKGLG